MLNYNSRQVRGRSVIWEDHRKRLVYPYGFGKNIHIYDEDFINFPVDDTTGDPVAWTVTMVEAGTGNSTFTSDNVSGGGAIITTDDNENDGVNAQLNGESFKLTSSCDLYFGAFGVTLSEATQSDVFVGLSITSTDILGGVTDSIGFRKVDGSTTLSYLLEKDSSETTGTATTMSTSAVDLELYHTGGGSVEFFVDGVSVGSSSTNLPDDEELRVSWHFLAGAAGTPLTCKIGRLTVVQIGT